jgi:regulator of protease activity HflC (stomatin/prohibitin superfamily)
MGCLIGFCAWIVVRYMLTGFYVVKPNERAVKTTFGRAQRLGDRTTADDPISDSLSEDHKQGYSYPLLKVIPPGGPYFRMPWEKVHKTSVALETVNMAYDPDNPTANQQGTILEAVTKDQLNTGLNGQIRYQVSERNLYAYFFGVMHPIAHVIGYFVSVLRERIASYEAPPPATDGAPSVEDLPTALGISINDLRKNLRDLNDHMDRECQSSAARYGVVLNASLIAGIDPPQEVDSALAAINTAHNQVSSDISLAQATADQTIVQSRRAVEIATLKSEAEAEPLTRMAAQLEELKKSGPDALEAYVRNVKLGLYAQTENLFLNKRS